MQWIELSAMVDSIGVESVSSILKMYGQGGATVEVNGTGEPGTGSQVVKIYLPHSRSYKNTRYEIVRSLAAVPFKVQLAERLLRPADWLDSLKQHFGILEVGDNLIIKPSWINNALPPSNRVIIELDPGAAFGTGMHSTTRLCLQRLERHLLPGMSVLDLGTGSGILAIAAAKMGASAVLALDIDSVAVKAAGINVKKNQADHVVKVKRGSLSVRTVREHKDSFDLAVANITAKAISDLSSALLRVLKSQGILIATGIHSTQLDEVLIRLAVAGFTIDALDQDEEWRAVVAVKP